MSILDSKWFSAPLSSVLCISTQEACTRAATTMVMVHLVVAHAKPKAQETCGMVEILQETGGGWRTSLATSGGLTHGNTGTSWSLFPWLENGMMTRTWQTTSVMKFNNGQNKRHKFQSQRELHLHRPQREDVTEWKVPKSRWQKERQNVPVHEVVKVRKPPQTLADSLKTRPPQETTLGNQLQSWLHTLYNQRYTLHADQQLNTYDNTQTKVTLSFPVLETFPHHKWRSL